MFISALDRESRRRQFLNMFSSRNIAAIRAGRLAFGIVVLGGVAALAWQVVASRAASTPQPDTVRVIGTTWLAALATGGAVHAAVRVFPSLRIMPRGITSFVVPAVGVALLLPITIHALWYLASGAVPWSFDRWATFALQVTAPSHVCFAIMVGRRATQLARGHAPVSVARIFVATVAVASFPFGIPMLMLPSVVVALTGIPIVPVLVLMERLAVPHRDGDLPVARVLA